MTDASAISADEIRRRMEVLGRRTPWYQNIELGHGIHTREDSDHPRQRWESMSPSFPASFAGKTVLDIACNAGFFGLQAAARGAEKVVGIDVSHDYIAQAKFCAEVLGYDVEYQVCNIADIAKLGQFDIVLCIGLLFHVGDIHGAIRAVSRATKEMALFETAIYRQHEDEPIVWTPPPGHRLPGFWHPTMTWMRIALQREGFARTEDVFVRGGRGGLAAYK